MGILSDFLHLFSGFHFRGRNDAGINDFHL